MQRLILITLACLMIVYIIVNFAYRPAMGFYQVFSSLIDRLSLLLLGAQPLENPESYLAFGQAWRSSEAYLFLTGFQWLIALASLAAWAFQLRKLFYLSRKRWMLWLMYTAFGILLASSVAIDYSGFLNANLQLRIFTPFSLFSSPMAAGLILRIYREFSIRRQRLAASAMILLAMFASQVTVLKVTNDPSFGNQWLFYAPAEAQTQGWINAHVQQRVWVDIGDHLVETFYFREGYYRINQYQWGKSSLPAPYILISEITRLRANRVQVSLPATQNQNQVYDNGVVQLYHRSAQTPYQR